MKKPESQYIVRGKVQRELEELKGLVREFMEAVSDRTYIDDLWDKLAKAVGEQNDRK